MKAFSAIVLFVLGLAPLAASAACTGEGLDLEKCLSKEYLDKMAKEDGAKVVDPGIVVRPIFTSTSTDHPTDADTVVVSYLLTDREGKTIETSLTDDQVATFPLNKLIQCWQIAIPTMSVGSFYKISCPSDTAYGDRGTSDGSVKGGAALTFRIMLHGFSKTKTTTSTF